MIKFREIARREIQSTSPNAKSKRNSNRDVDELSDVDHVATTAKTFSSRKDTDFIPSNVKSSHQEALLYVFEDNEAVIKMIIKGRSPTMRHVSRNPQSCVGLVV